MKTVSSSLSGGRGRVEERGGKYHRKCNSSTQADRWKKPNQYHLWDLAPPKKQVLGIPCSFQDPCLLYQLRLSVSYRGGSQRHQSPPGTSAELMEGYPYRWEGWGSCQHTPGAAFIKSRDSPWSLSSTDMQTLDGPRDPPMPTVGGKPRGAPA